MKITGKHVNAGPFPRKDGGPKPLETNNMISKLSKIENGFLINLSDKANPEFHIEIVLTEQELEATKNA